ncbi:hypothetical protein JB92DRAFT_2886167 [Gautieria morchelliformis]|nr:hypothetical protein JB92DRAFT_2886167 [Gautieria morchelliformis]
MLNLTSLRKVLSAVLSPPRLHTAILFTPSGNLIAHATNFSVARSRDQLRVLVGLASEVWLEVGDEGMGMVESELGRILVLPLHQNPQSGPSRPGRSTSRSPSVYSTSAPSHNDRTMLIALIAQDDVEWAELQIKAQGVVNHLSGPLIELGDRLLPSPARNRNSERFY